MNVLFILFIFVVVTLAAPAVTAFELVQISYPKWSIYYQETYK